MLIKKKIFNTKKIRKNIINKILDNDTWNSDLFDKNDLFKNINVLKDSYNEYNFDKFTFYFKKLNNKNIANLNLDSNEFNYIYSIINVFLNSNNINFMYFNEMFNFLIILSNIKHFEFDNFYCYIEILMRLLYSDNEMLNQKIFIIISNLLLEYNNSPIDKNFNIIVDLLDNNVLLTDNIKTFENNKYQLNFIIYLLIDNNCLKYKYLETIDYFKCIESDNDDELNLLMYLVWLSVSFDKNNELTFKYIIDYKLINTINNLILLDEKYINIIMISIITNLIIMNAHDKTKLDIYLDKMFNMLVYLETNDDSKIKENNNFEIIYNNTIRKKLNQNFYYLIYILIEKKSLINDLYNILKFIFSDLFNDIDLKQEIILLLLYNYESLLLINSDFNIFDYAFQLIKNDVNYNEILKKYCLELTQTYPYLIKKLESKKNYEKLYHIIIFN